MFLFLRVARYFVKQFNGFTFYFFMHCVTSAILYSVDIIHKIHYLFQKFIIYEIFFDQSSPTSNTDHIILINCKKSLRLEKHEI